MCVDGNVFIPEALQFAEVVVLLQQVPQFFDGNIYVPDDFEIIDS